MQNNIVSITISLVTQLVGDQFPQWADLSIIPVAVSGWDNRTFHLGDKMSVRLPSTAEYAPQVEKEQTWLPILASQLSIPISTPLAMGKPSKEYPFPWSVYAWIEGKSANMVNQDEVDLQAIAVQLAQFLHEMHAIDITGGPVTDRGGSPFFYDDEARASITLLHGLIDTQKATAVWNIAISSQWNKDPVWAHGDLSAGNILVKDRQLCAVIDFGGITIGDPACDLVIAWTFFQEKARQIFKDAMNLDEATWARARGWALWKAMISLEPLQDKNSQQAQVQLQIINDILDEYKSV